jgi:hypothetical protein
MSFKNGFFLGITFLLIVATRCASESEVGGGGPSNGKLKLTGEWTKDMHVSYYSGGGMLNEYTRFEIYSDSASYTMHLNESTNKYQLNFTSDELNQIAKLFYDNSYLSLRSTKHGLVYDKGARSITICDGSNCEEKGDDATSSYEGKDGERLYKIQNGVLAMVSKKMNELPKSTIELVFEKSLINTKLDYTVQFEPSAVQYNSKNDGKLNETTVELPAGSYNVNVYTHRQLAGGGTKYGGSGYITLNTIQNNCLTIGMAKDSSIILKPTKK